MPVNQVKRNGSYAPLSAHYYKDDAIAEAGPMAELLYVRGLAFCADVLSDGYISDVQFQRFVSVGVTNAKRHAARLCEVGLWRRDEAGYWVVAWARWNLTKEQIQEKQRKDAERKAGGK